VFDLKSRVKRASKMQVKVRGYNTRRKVPRTLKRKVEEGKHNPHDKGESSTCVCVRAHVHACEIVDTMKL